MWDLGTIQVVNIVATVLARQGKKERLSTCAAQRKSVGDDLIGLYKSHGISPEDALEHYSKRD